MKLQDLRKNYKKINGRTVFLRVDFNVPIIGSAVKEDFKLRQSLATINFLLSKKCKIILASHLGQPKNGWEKKYSLAPVAKQLAKLLAVNITFLDYKKYSDFKVIQKKIDQGGRLFLLDNLRFFPGEENNSKQLGKNLASLAEVYVNDAFAVSHRANASVSAIRSFKLPAYRGLLLEAELESLNKILHPKKPFVVVMGGAKISTKIPIIKKLYDKASYILLGGALINNFYLAQGLNVGRSLIDRDGLKTIKKYLSSKKIILPIDAIVKTSFDVKTKSKKDRISIKKITEIESNDCILDIGPATILLFSKYIKKAQTIVWNGPLGMFEDDNFKKGTVIIAREIASRSGGRAFGVAGGGETVEALNLSGMEKYMDWVSTGGGAMLSYLSGDKMPGLD
jgi:phosphoglycerate kinase